MFGTLEVINSIKDPEFTDVMAVQAVSKMIFWGMSDDEKENLPYAKVAEVILDDSNKLCVHFRSEK